jgi:hypothetical protein
MTRAGWFFFRLGFCALIVPNPKEEKRTNPPSFQIRNPKSEIPDIIQV